MGKPVKRARDRYLKAHQEAEEEGSPDPVGAAKKAVNSIKRKLPAVTFSGEFSQRGNDHIITHSGLLCLDLDHFQNGSELKAKLAADDYVQAFFVSPTGSGLKVLLRIAPEAAVHLQSFAAAAAFQGSLRCKNRRVVQRSFAPLFGGARSGRLHP